QAKGHLQRKERLRRLSGPVEYDTFSPRTLLKEPLESWSARQPLDVTATTPVGAVPPAGTFIAAHESFVWIDDPMLVQPHVEERERAERIFGQDPEKRPERLVLYSENK